MVGRRATVLTYRRSAIMTDWSVVSTRTVVVQAAEWIPVVPATVTTRAGAQKRERRDRVTVTSDFALRAALGQSQFSGGRVCEARDVDDAQLHGDGEAS